LDVEKIVFNPRVALKVPEQNAEQPDTRVRVSTVEQSLNVIQAPQVWAKGIFGTKAVIAGADTGTGHH